MKVYSQAIDKNGKRVSTNRNPKLVKSPKILKYTEKTVDEWFKRCVDEAGGLTFKNHPLTNAGIPDRVVHYRGRTFYVEMKTTGAECSPLQVEFHKRLKAKGIDTYVLDTKIVHFYDLYTVCYTEYESKYFSRNPKNKKQNENV